MPWSNRKLMAFKRFAKAITSRSDVEFEEWMEELRNQHEGAVPKDYVGRIAKTVLRKCDPKQYLLSHATIVASVDTYAPKGATTGTKMLRGCQINVRWPDYRIKPECQEIVNNNGDAWERSLLLSTYRTFIGAQNYCFTPDTFVLMADGTQKSIQDVSVGDCVISHTGTVRNVLHKFERQYSGDVCDVYVGHRQTPITCTPDHKFYVLDRDACEACGKPLITSNRPSSYRQRLHRQFCKDCGRKLRNRKSEGAYIRTVSASELVQRNIVYSPVTRTIGPGVSERFSKILGYYLADGWVPKGRNSVFFSLGSHEQSMFREIADAARFLDPGCVVSILRCENTENAFMVQVLSKKLSADLKEAGGNKSYGKKLSQAYVRSASSADILNLIGGFVNGDGDMHSATQRARAVSTSLDLLQQIQYLALRAGLNSFIVSHSINIGDQNEVLWADGSVHTITCRRPAWVLHFDVDSSKKLNEVLDPAKMQVRKVASGSFRFIDEKRVDSITKVERRHYEGPVFNLEVDVDHSFVVDGIVSTPQCEHIQIPELSKGFVVDAIARDLGKTVYVDILVATDRKHKILIQDIMSGKISSYSMGCISLFTICSSCGNVAADDSQLCPCVQFIGKGQSVVGEDGVEHKVSELIGHVSVPNSNQFIEASWVRNPAFRGAVRRQLLNPDMPTVAAKMDEAQSAYELRRDLTDFDGAIARAASVRKAQQGDEQQSAGQSQSDSGQEAPAEDDTDLGGAPSDSGTGSGPDAEASPKPSMDEMVEKAQQQLMEMIVKGLAEKLAPKPEDVGTAAPAPSVEAGNDNLFHASQEFSRKLSETFKGCPELVRWATAADRIVRGGRSSIRASGLTAKDMVVLSWIRDRMENRIHPSRLYQLAMTVGPTSRYPSETSFLAACKIASGKPLTASEKAFFTSKGRIASAGRDF